MEEKNYAKKLVGEYSQKTNQDFKDLKKLDKKVKRPARIFAYAFGIAGSLILGTGMCLAMNIIGGTTPFMIVGVCVGLVGIAMVSSNYAIYHKILSNRKNKYSSQIIEKSNQLLNN